MLEDKQEATKVVSLVKMSEKLPVVSSHLKFLLKPPVIALDMRSILGNIFLISTQNILSYNLKIDWLSLAESCVQPSEYIWAQLFKASLA